MKKLLFILFLLILPSLCQAGPEERKARRHRLIKRIAMIVAVGIIATQISTEEHGGLKRHSR